MIETLLRDLRQPEYVHTLLNPLPVYGVGLSLIGLVIALLLRSRPAQITALVLMFLSAAAAWPVIHFGENAYNNVLTSLDDDGRAWMDAHEERAEMFMYVFYALAVVSLAALFLPKKWPKCGTPLVVLAMVMAVFALSAGASIAYAGGKIRHREFRTVPPPQKAPKALIEWRRVLVGATLAHPAQIIGQAVRHP